MERFYCTICKKVKRVRVLPDDAVGDLGGEAPSEHYRTGTCRFHNRGDGESRARINHRGRVVARLGHIRKQPAVTAKVKGKKKGVAVIS